jgi:Ni/Co efflux regulator RcnB
MKTLITWALLIALAAPVAGAQGINGYLEDSRREQESRRQQEEIENLRRRQAEIERQQQQLERERERERRWQNNPVIPESQRQRCRPGQTFC